MPEHEFTQRDELARALVEMLVRLYPHQERAWQFCEAAPMVIGERRKINLIGMAEDRRGQGDF